MNLTLRLSIECDKFAKFHTADDIADIIIKNVGVLELFTSSINVEEISGDIQKCKECGKHKHICNYYFTAKVPSTGEDQNQKSYRRKICSDCLKLKRTSGGTK